MTVDSALKSLIKSIGENDEIQKVQSWVTTGYRPLNEALSGDPDGGWGIGRLYEMYGLESSGKTLMATLSMIAAQKAGGVAVFIDYERSFDLDMAVEMGLDPDQSCWFYKAPDTWEQGNGYVAKLASLIREHKIIDEDAPIFVVQDSIAAAVPESMKMKGSDFDSLNMNDTTALARIISTTLKSMAMYARDNSFCCLYLNQTREKIGVMFGDKTTTPGGNAMKFSASGRVMLSRKNEMVDDGMGGKVMKSQTVTAKAQKTKHTRPFKQTSYKIAFNENDTPYLDLEASYVDFAKKKGLLGDGGRLLWTNGKTYPASTLVKKIKDENLLPELEALVYPVEITKE